MVNYSSVVCGFPTNLKVRSKILFLTSSPTGDLDGEYIPDGLDDRNSFDIEVKKRWPDNAAVLMIAADPESYAGNDEMTVFFRNAVLKTGLSISRFDLWDRRYCIDSLERYDVIFLAGGHVPTENRWFCDIELKEKMKAFDGIVIGISAGSMNCSGVVFAQPELPGEATDPMYQRYIQGLGLVNDLNILPHYQLVKDSWKDGMRLMEDITYPESYGKNFIAIPDGSYLILENGETKIFGDAWLIRDGEIRKVN